MQFFIKNNWEEPVDRTPKVAPLRNVLADLRSGQTIAIGGSLLHNKPMALVREIIRSDVRDLVVIGVPQASIDVDMLIAAGRVAEVRVPYLGFEQFGLAPAYRKASAAGAITVWESDETHLLAGLEASAKDLPSAMVKAGVGTDLPKLNHDLVEVSDPITGEPMIAVAAIRPDFALLHAPAGDAFGNLFYPGYSFADLLLAEATKRGGGRVVASVDEVVGVSRATRDPHRTEIAHFLVDAVVETPFGAHPCSSHGNYQHDPLEFESYIAAVQGDEAALSAYFRERVHAHRSQEEYLDALVKPSTLAAMRRGIHG